MKGIVFFLIMALIAVVSYGMQRHDRIATRPDVRSAWAVKAACAADNGVSHSAAVSTPVSLPGSMKTRDYVNAWYGFSLSYPADWVEKPTSEPDETLRVGPSVDNPIPLRPLTVTVLPLYLYSLDQSPKVLASLLGSKARIPHEGPCCLKDGTPACEAEFEWLEDGRQVRPHGRRHEGTRAHHGSPEPHEWADRIGDERNPPLSQDSGDVEWRAGELMRDSCRLGRRRGGRKSRRTTTGRGNSP